MSRNPKDNSLPEGTKLYITHYRFSDDLTYQHGSLTLLSSYELRKAKLNILPRGGMTEVIIELPDGTTISATSVCSMRDNFSRTIGRNIALGRAMKQVRALVNA